MVGSIVGFCGRMLRGRMLSGRMLRGRRPGKVFGRLLRSSSKFKTFSDISVNAFVNDIRWYSVGRKCFGCLVRFDFYYVSIISKIF